MDTSAHELFDLTHPSANLDGAYMFCIRFGIQILTFKMYLHMKLIWPLCMVICWFYGSFWILVMNRVLVVSVGHLKHALSIFGHGPGIHLNTSELYESRFSFWFSFYSLTLYVLCFFKKSSLPGKGCNWIQQVFANKFCLMLMTGIFYHDTDQIDHLWRRRWHWVI